MAKCQKCGTEYNELDLTNPYLADGYSPICGKSHYEFLMNPNGSTQDQHIVTKGKTKYFGYKGKINAYNPETNLIEKGLNYKKVFSKKGLWSEELDKLFNDKIENPVLNQIIRKGNFKTTKKNIDLLIGYAHLQSLRFIVSQKLSIDPEILPQLLKNYKYLSYLYTIKIIDLNKSCNIPSSGIFGYVSNHVCYQMLAIKPRKIFIMALKPYTKELDKEIFNHEKIVRCSYGIKGQGVVLTNSVSVDEIKIYQEINQKELELFKNNYEQEYQIKLLSQSNFIMNKLIGYTADWDECELEAKVSINPEFSEEFKLLILNKQLLIQNNLYNPDSVKHHKFFLEEILAGNKSKHIPFFEELKKQLNELLKNNPYFNPK